MHDDNHTSALSPIATMDLNSLKDTVSNLTLYDLKAGVRKVQNGKPYTYTEADAPGGNHDLTVGCNSRDELYRDGGQGITAASLVNDDNIIAKPIH